MYHNINNTKNNEMTSRRIRPQNQHHYPQPPPHNLNICIFVLHACVRSCAVSCQHRQRQGRRRTPTPNVRTPTRRSANRLCLHFFYIWFNDEQPLFVNKYAYTNCSKKNPLTVVLGLLALYEGLSGLCGIVPGTKLIYRSEKCSEKAISYNWMFGVWNTEFQRIKYAPLYCH